MFVFFFSKQKVRLQTQVPDANGNLKYTGMGNAASLMLKEEGVKKKKK